MFWLFSLLINLDEVKGETWDWCSVTSCSTIVSDSTNARQNTPQWTELDSMKKTPYVLKVLIFCIAPCVVKLLECPYDPILDFLLVVLLTGRLDSLEKTPCFLKIWILWITWPSLLHISYQKLKTPGSFPDHRHNNGLEIKLDFRAWHLSRATTVVDLPNQYPDAPFIISILH